MVKILRKPLENYEAQVSKLSIFIGQKLIFHYCIQNVQDGIQIQVCNVSNNCLTLFCQFISEKVKKKVRKSQAQFQEKLRKVRLRQNCCSLIKKKTCTQPSQKFFH